MSPVDRRGLAEIVAWSCAVIMTGLVLTVAMVQRMPEAYVLTGLFSGVITALLSRGTKGAIDRDALREQRDQREASGTGPKRLE